MEKIKLSYLGSEFTKTEFSFSDRIKDLVKSAGSARWYPNDKYWYINRNKTLTLINIMKREGIVLDLDTDIQKDFNLSSRGKTKEELEERKIKRANDPSYAIDAVFDTTYLKFREGFDLYPYQRAGLVYMLSKNGRVLLGDDMGLGKTPQGIAMARHYQSDWPLVVIAPSSLVLNWKKEIMLWLPDIKSSDITVIKKGSQKPSGLITIASYDYATKQENAIKNYLGLRGVLLVDEAHNMKNPDAKRTKSLMSICHVVKRLAIITGTPFLSRPKEAWSLLNSINPSELEWSNQKEFELKFCEGKVIKIGKKHVYSANGAANIEYFHDVIREKVMIRRLKTDDGVLDQLPDKRRVTQYLDIDGNARTDLDSITQDISYRVMNAYSKYGKNLRELKKIVLEEATAVGAEDDIFKAYKLTGIAKVEQICEWLSDKLDGSNAKFIVFGHHKDFLSGICDTLSRKKIDFMKIDGATSKEKRFANTERFQSDPTCRVAVLSIQAASVGLTLTAASEVVMGEFPWTPALAQQAECRAHRNGQKELVTCYYMIANNTIDGFLWNMLSKKSVVSSLMLDGGDGDEMEEDINIDTGDILDSIILSIDKAFKSNLLSIDSLPKNSSEVDVSLIDKITASF